MVRNLETTEKCEERKQKLKGDWAFGYEKVIYENVVSSESMTGIFVVFFFLNFFVLVFFFGNIYFLCCVCQELC